MSDKTPLLSVNNLSMTYGFGEDRVDAVRKVSFDVDVGEVIGLVGESGSGKSTVAQTILGLLDQSSTTTSGTIQFAGENIFTYDSRRWERVRGRRIGMIFQSAVSSFNPVTTIGEQMVEALRWHMALSKTEANKAAFTALNDVGMPRPEEVMYNYAFELSGGMCQRAALAMVMALKPSLVLADEPTASLDVVAQAELVRWLGSIQKKRGFSMLVISHDLNLISRLADRLLVMYEGKIIERGRAQSVLTNPQHAYTEELVNAVPRLTKPTAVTTTATPRQAYAGVVAE
jgi:ABC-type glutathione transport system ATPase component